MDSRSKKLVLMGSVIRAGVRFYSYTDFKKSIAKLSGSLEKVHREPSVNLLGDLERERSKSG